MFVFVGVRHGAGLLITDWQMLPPIIQCSCQRTSTAMVLPVRMTICLKIIGIDCPVFQVSSKYQWLQKVVLRRLSLRNETQHANDFRNPVLGEEGGDRPDGGPTRLSAVSGPPAGMDFKATLPPPHQAAFKVVHVGHIVLDKRLLGESGPFPVNAVKHDAVSIKQLVQLPF